MLIPSEEVINFEDYSGEILFKIRGYEPATLCIDITDPDTLAADLLAPACYTGEQQEREYRRMQAAQLFIDYFSDGKQFRDSPDLVDTIVETSIRSKNKLIQRAVAETLTHPSIEIDRAFLIESMRRVYIKIDAENGINIALPKNPDIIEEIDLIKNPKINSLVKLISLSELAQEEIKDKEQETEILSQIIRMATSADPILARESLRLLIGNRWTEYVLLSLLRSSGYYGFNTNVSQSGKVEYQNDTLPIGNGDFRFLSMNLDSVDQYDYEGRAECITEILGDMKNCDKDEFITDLDRIDSMLLIANGSDREKLLQHLYNIVSEPTDHGNMEQINKKVAASSMLISFGMRNHEDVPLRFDLAEVLAKVDLSDLNILTALVKGWMEMEAVRAQSKDKTEEVACLDGIEVAQIVKYVLSSQLKTRPEQETTQMNKEDRWRNILGMDKSFDSFPRAFQILIDAWLYGIRSKGNKYTETREKLKALSLQLQPFLPAAAKI